MDPRIAHPATETGVLFFACEALAMSRFCSSQILRRSLSSGVQIAFFLPSIERLPYAYMLFLLDSFAEKPFFPPGDPRNYPFLFVLRKNLFNLFRNFQKGHDDLRVKGFTAFLLNNFEAILMGKGLLVYTL